MNPRSLAALLGGACLAFVGALGARQERPQPKPLAVPLAAKLQTDIERTAASVDGVMGIYAQNLETGETFAVNADAVFPQGSSIKIPILITLLPASWQNTAGPYLPMNAGEVIYSVQHQAHTLGPWAGLGVFSGYAAAALLAGFIMISRRDA